MSTPQNCSYDEIIVRIHDYVLKRNGKRVTRGPFCRKRVQDNLPPIGDDQTSGASAASIVNELISLGKVNKKIIQAFVATRVAVTQSVRWVEKDGLYHSDHSPRIVMLEEVYPFFTSTAPYTNLESNSVSSLESYFNLLSNVFKVDVSYFQKLKLNLIPGYNKDNYLWLRTQTGLDGALMSLTYCGVSSTLKEVELTTAFQANLSVVSKYANEELVETNPNSLSPLLKYAFFKFIGDRKPKFTRVYYLNIRAPRDNGVIRVVKDLYYKLPRPVRFITENKPDDSSSIPQVRFIKDSNSLYKDCTLGDFLSMLKLEPFYLDDTIITQKISKRYAAIRGEISYYAESRPHIYDIIHITFTCKKKCRDFKTIKVSATVYELYDTETQANESHKISRYDKPDEDQKNTRQLSFEKFASNFDKTKFGTGILEILYRNVPLVENEKHFYEQIEGSFCGKCGLELVLKSNKKYIATRLGLQQLHPYKYTVHTLCLRKISSPDKLVALLDLLPKEFQKETNIPFGAAADSLRKSCLIYPYLQTLLPKTRNMIILNIVIIGANLDKSKFFNKFIAAIKGDQDVVQPVTITFRDPQEQEPLPRAGNHAMLLVYSQKYKEVHVFEPNGKLGKAYIDYDLLKSSLQEANREFDLKNNKLSGRLKITGPLQKKGIQRLAGNAARKRKTSLENDIGHCLHISTLYIHLFIRNPDINPAQLDEDLSSLAKNLPFLTDFLIRQHVTFLRRLGRSVPLNEKALNTRILHRRYEPSNFIELKF